MTSQNFPELYYPLPGSLRPDSGPASTAPGEERGGFPVSGGLLWVVTSPKAGANAAPARRPCRVALRPKPFGFGGPGQDLGGDLKRLAARAEGKNLSGTAVTEFIIRNISRPRMEQLIDKLIEHLDQIDAEFEDLEAEDARGEACCDIQMDAASLINSFPGEPEDAEVNGPPIEPMWQKVRQVRARKATRSQPS